MPEAETEFCVAITSAPNEEEARSLACMLLDQQLAACVQLLPIESFYMWEGKVANEPEKLLLIKTRRPLYKEVERAIREAHSYEVPEVICLPVADGSDAYLAWVREVTR